MDLNKNLRYGTTQHTFVRDALRQRIDMAQTGLGDRYEEWRRMEEQYRAYMPVRENDRIRTESRKGGKPEYTTIEIPYSYAAVLSAHTYLTSTFLARNPIMQFQGRHGETQQQEMKVEAIMDYQLQVGQHLVPYYIWMLDPLKYGVGVIGYHWDQEKITRGQFVEAPVTFLGIPVPGKTKKEYIEEELIGYEGTRAYNVRPQDWFPDPRYPFNQFQKGEFCGRYVEMSYLDILADKESYINLEALAASRKDIGATLRIEGSSQVTLPNEVPNGATSLLSTGQSNGDEISSGSVECYEVYVRIIPKEWRVGTSDRPQKWVFLLADDDIVIQARPLGYYHDKFPFGVLEQEVDGHSLFSRSMLEITKPLNDVLTWLINTHFYNVRKSLNDQFVADPSRVVMKDLINPDPGKLIRLKPAAYGQDVRTMVSQLPVQDVTRSHLNDAGYITDLLARVTGVNDNIMGAVNTGRRSATEVRSSTTFGINRLKTTAEYYSSMGFGPWTSQLVQTTQQFMSDERAYRIVGDLAVGNPDRFINVTPSDISGFYDWVPIDGTLPVDRMAQVNLWTQLFSQLQAMPQIAMQYDLGRIFAFVAQLAGLKNINQFRIAVVPDAQALNQAQQGNVIPMPNVATGGSIQPPQMPGMGQQL